MQVGSTIVTSAFGFFYWWAATHLFLPGAVGMAAASISAMQLLATLSVLGLGTLLISELPRRSHEQGTLVKMALTTAAISGCLIGGVGALVFFVVLRDWKTSDLSLLMIGLFIGGVSLSAVCLLVDQAVIGLNISSLMLGRNVIFAAVKLLAIAATAVVLVPRDWVTIFATWVIGIIVSLAIILGLPVWRRYRSRRSQLRAWQLLRSLARSSLQHHILNLALAAPSMAMPTVALVVLSAASAAYFYSALTLANFAYMIPFALSISLFAASSAKVS
jgi:O-antigen/teichoic acid export membrane protein